MISSPFILWYIGIMILGILTFKYAYLFFYLMVQFVGSLHSKFK